MDNDNDVFYAILYMLALAVVMIGAVAAMINGLTGLGIFLLFILLGLFAVPFVIFAKAYNKGRK